MERDDDEKDERGGAGTSRSRGRAMAHRADSSRGGIDVDIHAAADAVERRRAATRRVVCVVVAVETKTSSKVDRCYFVLRA
jgi:hypothetical protein